jgi:3D (Asp-Asp-Asp) domain-containing protein
VRHLLVSLLVGGALCVPAFAASSSTFSGVGTAYHSCDGSTSITASGKQARVGYVANNSLPLGTWIEMVKPRTVMSRRWFQVQDRGGGAFALDFWAPSCAWMYSWGSQQVSFKVVPKSKLYKGKPVDGWTFKSTGKGSELVWRAE